MNEIGQIKEGIILVAVIIAFIIMFQIFGYFDRKSKHSSIGDEVTQEETWDPIEKNLDETVIIKPASSSPKDSVSSTSTKNSYYRPITPDEKREAEKKLQRETERKKAGW